MGQGFKDDKPSRISKTCHLTYEQKLLVGAFFTKECSIESVAFFNPSIVSHPDQAGLPESPLKVIFSFWAVGHSFTMAQSSFLISFRNSRLAVGLAFLFALLAGLPAGLTQNKEIPAAAPARTNTNGNLLVEEVENRIQKFLRGLICSSFNIDPTVVLVKKTRKQDHFREIIQRVKVCNFHITDDGLSGIEDPYFKIVLFCCGSHDPLQSPDPIRIQF
jgi:hypothetical protein